MEDDIKQKLQRAAAGAIDPEDRAWAAAKYQEMYGTAPAKEGVPDMLKRPALDPLDAAMQRRQQEPQDEDMGSKVASAGKYLGSEMLDGLKGIGGMIYRPIANTPRSKDMAERGENLVSNAADTFTLGAYSGLTDMAGITNPQQRAEMAQKHPGGSMYGQGVGALGGALAGPARFISEGVNKGLSRLAPELMGTALGRVGGAVTAGAAVGGTQGALESGGDLETTLEGVAGGAGTSLVAAGVPEGVRAARSTIQGASPWIGRYNAAKESGKLDAAEALPKGQEGITRASEGARDKILARRDAKMSEAGGKYQAAESAESAAPADVGKVREALDKVRQGNLLSSGRPVSQALDDEISALESQLLDDVPTSDLLALRRSLQERANFQNKSPSDREMASRKLYDALRQGVRASSPKLAEADDMFSAASKEAGKTDELLGSSKPIKSFKQKRAAAAELEHLGNDSVPAQRRAPDLEALAKQDPAFAQALDDLMAKKALEATRLSLNPGTRSSFTPAVSHIGGMPLQVAAQLGRAGGRMADQSLRAMQPAANLAPSLSLSLIDAFMQRRREQEK